MQTSPRSCLEPYAGHSSSPIPTCKSSFWQRVILLHTLVVLRTLLSTCCARSSPHGLQAKDAEPPEPELNSTTSTVDHLGAHVVSQMADQLSDGSLAAAISELPEASAAAAAPQAANTDLSGAPTSSALQVCQ